MVDRRNDPSNTTIDYDAMAPFWTKVDTFRGGVAAMRAAGKTYLQKFEEERDEDYQDRLKIARFTNLYSDIVKNLADKPFAEEVQLDKEADEVFVELCKDIDGKGNSLHVFAGDVFEDGLHRTIDWILVDFTKGAQPSTGRPRSRAEERAQGLRPYWVHIPATALLAIESDFVGGKEVFTHARWREDVVERDGYAQVCKERIRVMNRLKIEGVGGRAAGYEPATWELFEKREGENGEKEWVSIDSGVVDIGEIALVPFWTGERIGTTWQFVPALQAVADAQLELYELENDLKWSGKMTAFPMLSANGVNPEMEGEAPKKLKLGPRSVLYAPPVGDNGQHGEWAYVEPAGSSLTFLSGEVEKLKKEMRELGRQPLTADTGNLTVVTTAFAAQKGNSACQAWALALQTALERALKLTAMWLKMEDKAPKVRVYTDFEVETDDKGPDVLTSARKNGDLSRETYWEELKRRKILNSDFDPEKEAELLDQEAEDKIAYEKDLFDATTPDLDPVPPGQQPPPKPANQQRKAPPPRKAA